MKTVVINLPTRKDRLASFNTNNPNLPYELFRAVDGYKISYKKLVESGFDTNHDWIDPLLNTPLTKAKWVAFYRIGIFGISASKRMKQCWY